MKQMIAALLLLTLAAQQSSAELTTTFDTFDQFQSLSASPITADGLNATSVLTFFSTQRYHQSDSADVSPRSVAPLLEARQAASSSVASECTTSDCTSSYDTSKKCPDTTYAFLSCFCADSGLEMAKCYSTGCGIETVSGTDVTLFVLEACILYLSDDVQTASECLLSRNGYSTACSKSAQYTGSGEGLRSAVSGSASAAAGWSASATATRSASAALPAAASSSRYYSSAASSMTFYVPDTGSSGNANNIGASFIPQPSQTTQAGASNAAVAFRPSVQAWTFQLVLGVVVVLAALVLVDV